MTTGPVGDAVVGPPDLDARSAARIFWITALAYGGLTALLPPLCFPTFRSDVLEQIIVGREWVLGTAKHPALTTWIMQVFWTGLGGSRFAPSVAASACATVTMWAVWRLGREYVSERAALLGSLGLTAYWYTNVGGATMYNNNVTLIMFWHLAILSAHHALKTNAAWLWIQTGLLLAASLLCKYTAVVLGLSIGLFMLLDVDARRRLRTAGPWLAAAVVVAVVTPHVVSMRATFGGVAAYVETKRSADALPAFCLRLGRDWLLQGLVASSFLLILGPVVGRRPRLAPRGAGAAPAASFLAAMFLLPIIVQTVVQVVLRVPFVHRSYGAHLWVLTGLCGLSQLAVTNDPRRWRAAGLVTAAVAAALLASLPISTAAAYRLATGVNARFYPGRELAATIDAVWSREATGPCRYLASREGDPYPGWAAGAYSRHQPHVIDAALGRWAGDAEMNRDGGVVVWAWRGAEERAALPADIAARFPRAWLAENVDLSYLMIHPAAPQVRFGVAVVPARRPTRLAAEPAGVVR